MHSENEHAEVKYVDVGDVVSVASMPVETFISKVHFTVGRVK